MGLVGGFPAVGQKLVLVRRAHTSIPRLNVFEFPQPLQMRPDLRNAPAQPCPDRPAAEEGNSLLDLLPVAPFAHDGLDGLVHPPCLRRQFIERAAQQFRSQPVRQGDIVERGPDERHRAARDLPGLGRPLVLVKQGDDVNEREILLMVAPGAGAVSREGQFIGIGIHDG